jgi:tRNA-binding EMAP/Myf-like protein
LYCESIDIGAKHPKQVASGLRAHYSLEEMQGRRLLVVTNLKSAKMGKFTSSGMVLCAKNGEKVVFVEPPADAKVGEIIFIKGMEGHKPFSANQMKKKKVLEKIFPELKTDGDGVATFQGLQLMTSAGACTAPLANAMIN